MITGRYLVPGRVKAFEAGVARPTADATVAAPAWWPSWHPQPPVSPTTGLFANLRFIGYPAGRLQHPFTLLRRFAIHPARCYSKVHD